jgi:ribosomal protein L14E/L6E/L27E
MAQLEAKFNLLDRLLNSEKPIVKKVEGTMIKFKEHMMKEFAHIQNELGKDHELHWNKYSDILFQTKKLEKLEETRFALLKKHDEILGAADAKFTEAVSQSN